MQKRATTLWEFCLVIAFLAILVAAVIPSLTDADISAQVSQARTDMRAIGSALEAYRHDYPRYPLDYVFDLSKGSSSSPTSGKKYLACLTTPVPYLPTLPGDVFFSTKTIGASFDYRYYGPDWIGLQVLGAAILIEAKTVGPLFPSARIAGTTMDNMLSSERKRSMIFPICPLTTVASTIPRTAR